MSGKSCSGVVIVEQQLLGRNNFFVVNGRFWRFEVWRWRTWATACVLVRSYLSSNDEKFLSSFVVVVNE